jgi:hypothetical protein
MAIYFFKAAISTLVQIHFFRLVYYVLVIYLINPQRGELLNKIKINLSSCKNTSVWVGVSPLQFVVVAAPGGTWLLLSLLLLPWSCLGSVCVIYL